MPVSVFDGLRYGYFDVAVGNMLKAIRGGANPIGVTTLSMCYVGALSSIEWTLANDASLEDSGRVVRMTPQQRQAIGNFDRTMFEGWLTRWVKDSGINPNCDPERTYGARCALVHTGGGSEALLNLNVIGWEIRASNGDRPMHYQVFGNNFVLYMPDFIAELMLASDLFFNQKMNELNSASEKQRKRICGIGIYTATDVAGNVVGRTVPRKTLEWFDEADELKLSQTPLRVSVEMLSDKIQDFYSAQDEAGLIMPAEFKN